MVNIAGGEQNIKVVNKVVKVVNKALGTTDGEQSRW